MRSLEEPKLLSAFIQHDGQLQGALLIKKSSGIISTDSEGKITSWGNLSSRKWFWHQNIFGNITTNGNLYPLKKDTYDDWVLINKQPSLLQDFLGDNQVNFISEEQYNQLRNDYEHRWTCFYWLTRPGFSQYFSQAIIQLAFYCPSACHYASIFHLQKISNRWEVNSSYGLYNQ
ncbi:hypothetical protein [Anabaena sp. UHCC 0399]|uniref:hypothetical protein n=1 Tax=Anabaena sp. UHCC 0399 TaxID=3110238 RepID=UPI002B216821|nr:hypothetical protein [Anabaena sp. UHCC 0399]MEA5568124.1 hypothetical protein [Anabaena sp. UHCC 0399]